MKNTPQSVDEYISSFNEPIRTQLEALRKLIKRTIPNVEEKISWGAPCYYLNGYLLMFSANKNDIGFYTNKETVDHFRIRASAYRPNKKNTIAIPFEEALPEELLRDMILFCRDNR